jgi:hypothetical protein
MLPTDIGFASSRVFADGAGGFSRGVLSGRLPMPGTLFRRSVAPVRPAPTPHPIPTLDGKNLARNLATPHGTKRKKRLQGTCKVAFFGVPAEQK